MQSGGSSLSSYSDVSEINCTILEKCILHTMSYCRRDSVTSFHRQYAIHLGDVVRGEETWCLDGVAEYINQRGKILWVEWIDCVPHQPV
jgi:hypothetical protein